MKYSYNIINYNAFIRLTHCIKKKSVGLNILNLFPLVTPLIGIISGFGGETPRRCLSSGKLRFRENKCSRTVDLATWT